MTEQAKETVEIYCVKCRAKKSVERTSVERIVTTQGPYLLRATCPTCGITMGKFTKRQSF